MTFIQESNIFIIVAIDNLFFTYKVMKIFYFKKNSCNEDIKKTRDLIIGFNIY